MDSSPESLNNNIRRHHHQHTETPPASLCRGGCGFFGSEANRGLCSKCYNNFLLQKPSLSVNPLDPIPPTNRKRQRTTDKDDDHDHAIVSNPPLIVKNRCRKCRKKIGVTGFSCKCGEIFCGSHRHPEAHACEFDFKISGRFALFKENPVCKGDKLNDRV